MKPEVSVLVLTRNRPHIIKECIDSILMQSNATFEIIILEDSPDPHLTIDRAPYVEDNRIRFEKSSNNLGIAEGRNRLASMAKAETMVFLDDDAVFLSPNSLSQLAVSFKGSKKLGAVAFKIHLIEKNLRGYQVPFRRRIYSHNSKILESEMHVSYFVGAGHALRKSAFEIVKGYQSDLVWGNEELDLSYRLISEGYHLVYCPNIEIEHRPLPSVVKSKNRELTELFYFTRNRIWLAYKYLPLPYFPVYVLYWMTYYFSESLKLASIKTFIRGFIAGVTGCTKLNRNKLNKTSIEYLKAHYGRLWT